MASTNAGRLVQPITQSHGEQVFTLSNGRSITSIPYTSKSNIDCPVLVGCPIQDPLLGEQVEKPGQNRYASQLIQDLNVIDTLSHVTRERIPER